VLIELDLEFTSPSLMDKIAEIVRTCDVIGVQTTSDSATCVFEFSNIVILPIYRRRKKLNLKNLKE